MGAYTGDWHKLFEPYGGYLHLLPRIVAWLGQACVDPALIPAFYNFSALGFTLAVMASVFSKRVCLPAKPAFVVAMALVPHTGEVFINLTNLQWSLALSLVVLSIKNDADGVAERILDFSIALFAGLTGPFIVFLLPAFVCRAVSRKSRESLWLLVWVLMVAAVQFYFLFNERVSFARPEPVAPIGILSAMAGRNYVTFIAGYALPAFERHYVWIALGGVCTALLGFFSLRRGDYKLERLNLFLIFLCLSASVAFKFMREVGVIIPPNQNLGDRYFYIQHVLIAWILVIALVSTVSWWRYCIVAVFVAALAFNLKSFKSPALADRGWSAHAQSIRDGKAFTIPINPDGWAISAPARPAKP